MNKIRCSVILVFGILLIGNMSAEAQKIPYMSLIDSQEMKYMDNAEVSIDAWREYQYYTKNKYGENSKEFASTIFDTVIFKKHYNKCFSYSPTSIHISINKESSKKPSCDYPMIGISYDQCLDYCKWRTEVYNYKVKGVKKITFSLPSEFDYANAVSNAKITDNPPLSKLINKKRGQIYGLTDNVKEYVLDNKINPNGNPIGFRCVAIIEKD